MEAINNNSNNNWSPNFRGTNQHMLTRQDAIKGGQTGKAMGNVNNLKHGRYATKTKIANCNECNEKETCALYEQNSKCSWQLRAIKNISAAVRGNPEALQKEMDYCLQRIRTIAESNPDNVVIISKYLDHIKDIIKLYFPDVSKDMQYTPIKDMAQVWVDELFGECKEEGQ